MQFAATVTATWESNITSYVYWRFPNKPGWCHPTIKLTVAKLLPTGYHKILSNVKQVQQDLAIHLALQKKICLNAQCYGNKATATFLILLHLNNEENNQGDFLFTKSIIICPLGLRGWGASWCILFSSCLKKKC